MSSTIHRARWLIVEPERVLSGGALEIAHGCVVRVLASEGELRTARASAGFEDHGDVVLVPGLVDAHAHLELSGQAGLLPRTGSFAAWITALLAARRARALDDLVRDACAGIDRLLAGGTTLVGDIDSSGAIDLALALRPLRARVYREVLDARDPARTDAALAALDERLRGPPAARVRSRRVWQAISPHAPYTASEALLGRLGVTGGIARRRRLPIGIHWAETEEEVEWLAHGTGPLATHLSNAPEAPRASGLTVIEAAGLLGPRTALYHGNLPEPGERARVAAAGATLVHCPGTHAYFGRPSFAFEPWRAAGVTIALGTDSLASNDELDMRREMALVRASDPGLAPETVLAMATISGARALGLARRAGTLAPGAWADFAAHEIDAGSAAGVLEALTSGAGTVREVRIDGRTAFAR